MSIIRFSFLGFFDIINKVLRSVKENVLIRFVDKPYVTEKVAYKLPSIKWKMACGIGMTRFHFITLADNSKDLFDIYPAAVFKQKNIRRSDRVIIGVADSYSSATGLIEQMINECLEAGKKTEDFRGYFEDFVRDHT